MKQMRRHRKCLDERRNLIPHTAEKKKKEKKLGDRDMVARSWWGEFPLTDAWGCDILNFHNKIKSQY